MPSALDDVLGSAKAANPGGLGAEPPFPIKVLFLIDVIDVGEAACDPARGSESGEGLRASFESYSTFWNGCAAPDTEAGKRIPRSGMTRES